jgi:hypothetical protein
MSKITYTDKVALNVNSDIADINKVNASDLNEIKEVVNTNDDNTTNNSNAIGNLSSLNTTNKNNLVNSINEVNNKFNYSTSEQVIGKWTNGKPIYRKVVTGTVPKDGYPTVATGITNLDKVVSISLVLAYGDNRQYFTSVRYDNYYLSKENDNQITVVTPDIEGDATFTICYTKTTD